MRRRCFRRCLSTGVSRAVPFLEYARSARQDVAEVMDQLKGSPVERLHSLSLMALEIWPKEAPQWRLAGELLPQLDLKEFKRELQSGKLRDGATRATMLKALCEICSKPSMRLAENVATEQLVFKLSLEELCGCVSELSASGWHPLPKESNLRAFAQKGVERLDQGAKSLALEHLLATQSSASTLGFECRSVLAELRKRLLRVARPRDDGPTGNLSGQVGGLVAAAHALGETAALKSSSLREALLPGVLSLSDAIEVLRHGVPRSLTPADELLVSLAVREILADLRQMSTKQLARTVSVVRSLQATQQAFALRKSSELLQGLWPKATAELAYLGPGEAVDLLCAYWWQLLYSNQEDASADQIQAQPLPKKGDKAVQELSTKLLRPVLANLQELSLKQVAACLSVLAPPLKAPDLMPETDRKQLQDAVVALFQGEEDPRPRESSEVFVEAWMQDFWQSELKALQNEELLELACGLREAGVQQFMPKILEDLDQRLKRQQKVELSHFLLVRMCRQIDLWHQHEMEAVLGKLLAEPEALKPLPNGYFVALVASLTSFAVPKDIPLRLVSSFLERARGVTSEEWAELLCAVRPLDEPFFERITPRLLQQLLPHLQALSDASLLRVLDVLAKASRNLEESCANSPLEQAPAAFNEAVAEALKSKNWDLPKALEAFASLGRLGWYSERTVAQVLHFVMAAPFLEPHAPLLLPLVRACNDLHVHHAPLLSKAVGFYCWCYAYLWTKPLGVEKLDELLELAEQASSLSFQSMELQSVLAENLTNPNATSRQALNLLSLLARCAHFPPEFKATCARIGSQTSDADLMSLTSEELVNAFNIHLCGVFDGPAALKHWLTEDDRMKLFFQVHTSQKWYQKQDYFRSQFRQSEAYTSLRDAAERLSLDLRTSDPGEVYHVEFVSSDAKERIATSEKPPLAVMCISSKEELRWYVPITVAPSEDLMAQNRCRQFRYMFRGAVQKVRHVQTMGYRPCIVWMSEWKKMTQEQQAEYLKQAAADYQVFKPAAAEDEMMYI